MQSDLVSNYEILSKLSYRKVYQREMCAIVLQEVLRVIFFKRRW